MVYHISLRYKSHQKTQVQDQGLYTNLHVCSPQALVWCGSSRAGGITIAVYIVYAYFYIIHQIQCTCTGVHVYLCMLEGKLVYGNPKLYHTHIRDKYSGWVWDPPDLLPPPQKI